MMRTGKNNVPRTSLRLLAASEWLVAFLLSANLIWTALCLGGVRAETMVWSGTLTCAIAAIVVLRHMVFKTGAHRAPVWLLPFLLYALFSACALSPVRWLAIREWLLWMQLFLVFAIVLNGLQSQAPRRLVLGTTLLLGAIALVLSAYQLNGHEAWLMLGRSQAIQYIGRASGFFGNPNSLAALYVLIIPPLLSLAWRRGADGVRRVACGYVALALMAGLVLTLSRGGWLALAIALVCWPWFVGEWRWKRRALASAGVLAAVVLGALTVWATLPSARARIERLAGDHGEKSRVILWQASLKMTAGSPLLGVGAGSFNTVFEKHRPEGFLNNPQWAHNDFLNILSDYGIVGFALLFGGIGAIAWRSRRRGSLPPSHAITDDARAAASFTRALGIGLLAFACASLVDFHTHIPALGMIAAVHAAEFLKRREVSNDVLQPAAAPRTLHCIAALACLSLLACVIAKTDSAEALRVNGREQIDALAVRREKDGAGQLQTLMRSGVHFAKAVRRDPGNAQAWADCAYALALRARIDKPAAPALGREAESAARRAIELAPEVYEFWLRLGVALDLQARAAEAGEAFTHALQLAPASPLAWYHQAYHLSLAPATRHLALGAIEICLRLDPGHRDADILRERLQSNR